MVANIDMFVTYWGRVTHICFSELGYHWFRLWPVACSVPSLSLHKCQLMINWTIWNIFKWNLNNKIQHFPLKKRCLKISFEKYQPCCFGLNVWFDIHPKDHARGSYWLLCFYVVWYRARLSISVMIFWVTVFKQQFCKLWLNVSRE